MSVSIISLQAATLDSYFAVAGIYKHLLSYNPLILAGVNLFTIQRVTLKTTVNFISFLQ